MGLEVPSWAAEMFGVFTGDGWPTADEDAIRDLAGLWLFAGAQLLQYVPEVTCSARFLADSGVLAGDAQLALSAVVSMVTGNGDLTLEKLAAGFEELGQYLQRVGLQTQYMKIVIFEEMLILAAQIAYLIAMIPWVFGASTAGIHALQLAGRAFALGVMRQLAIAIAAGEVLQVGLDAIAQLVQTAEGWRGVGEWDQNLTRSAAITGVVAGVLGPVVYGVGRYSGRALTQALNKTLARGTGSVSAGVLSRDAAGELGHLANETVKGAEHEYLTDGVSGLVQGQGWRPQTLSLTAGAVDEGVSAGAGRGRRSGGGKFYGNLAAGKPGIKIPGCLASGLPRLDPEAPPAAGTEGEPERGGALQPAPGSDAAVDEKGIWALVQLPGGGVCLARSGPTPAAGGGEASARFQKAGVGETSHRADAASALPPPATDQAPARTAVPLSIGSGGAARSSPLLVQLAALEALRHVDAESAGDRCGGANWWEAIVDRGGVIRGHALQAEVRRRLAVLTVCIPPESKATGNREVRSATAPVRQFGPWYEARQPDGQGGREQALIAQLRRRVHAIAEEVARFRLEAAETAASNGTASGTQRAPGAWPPDRLDWLARGVQMTLAELQRTAGQEAVRSGSLPGRALPVQRLTRPAARDVAVEAGPLAVAARDSIRDEFGGRLPDGGVGVSQTGAGGSVWTQITNWLDVLQHQRPGTASPGSVRSQVEDLLDVLSRLPPRRTGERTAVADVAYGDEDVVRPWRGLRLRGRANRQVRSASGGPGGWLARRRSQAPWSWAATDDNVARRRPVVASRTRLFARPLKGTGQGSRVLMSLAGTRMPFGGSWAGPATLPGTVSTGVVDYRLAIPGASLGNGTVFHGGGSGLAGNLAFYRVVGYLAGSALRPALRGIASMVASATRGIDRALTSALTLPTTSAFFHPFYWDWDYWGRPYGPYWDGPYWGRRYWHPHDHPWDSGMPVPGCYDDYDDALVLMVALILILFGIWYCADCGGAPRGRRANRGYHDDGGGWGPGDHGGYRGYGGYRDHGGYRGPGDHRGYRDHGGYRGPGDHGGHRGYGGYRDHGGYRGYGGYRDHVDDQGYVVFGPGAQTGLGSRGRRDDVEGIDKKAPGPGGGTSMRDPQPGDGSRVWERGESSRRAGKRPESDGSSSDGRIGRRWRKDRNEERARARTRGVEIRDGET